MPGPSRPGGGEKVQCRCMLCHEGVELQEGQKCEAVRCPLCGGPLHSDIEITKTQGPRGPGRRREEEDEAKIAPGWWPDGWEPKPPLLGIKECRCPSCQYVVEVEAGTRCLLTDCPRCGHRMVEV